MPANPDCRWWAQGLCLLNYKNNPTYGQCRRCDKREPTTTAQSIVPAVQPTPVAAAAVPAPGPPLPQPQPAKPGDGYPTIGPGQNQQPPPAKGGLAAAAKHVAKGVAGLTKAGVAQATGVGKAPEPVIAARQEICNTCDKATRSVGGLVTKCSECGCFLAAKQKLVNEACPLKKWDNIGPDGTKVVPLTVIK